MPLRDNSVLSLFDFVKASYDAGGGGLSMSHTGAGTAVITTGALADLATPQLSKHVVITRAGTNSGSITRIRMAVVNSFRPHVASALDLRFSTVVGSAQAQWEWYGPFANLLAQSPLFNIHSPGDGFAKTMEHPTHVVENSDLILPEYVELVIRGVGSVSLGRYWLGAGHPVRLYRESVKTDYIDNSVQNRTEGEQAYNDSKAITRQISAILPDLTHEEVYGGGTANLMNGNLVMLDRVIRQVGKSLPWILIPDPTISLTNPSAMARQVYYGSPTQFGPMLPLAVSPIRYNWSLALREER